MNKDHANETLAQISLWRIPLINKGLLKLLKGRRGVHKERCTHRSANTFNYFTKINTRRQQLISMVCYCIHALGDAFSDHPTAAALPLPSQDGLGYRRRMLRPRPVRL